MRALVVVLLLSALESSHIFFAKRLCAFVAKKGELLLLSVLLSQKEGALGCDLMRPTLPKRKRKCCRCEKLLSSLRRSKCIRCGCSHCCCDSLQMLLLLSLRALVAKRSCCEALARCEGLPLRRCQKRALSLRCSPLQKESALVANSPCKCSCCDPLVAKILLRKEL